jgi:hypothetical protein
VITTTIILGIPLWAFFSLFLLGLCRAASAGDRTLTDEAGEAVSSPERYSGRDRKSGRQPVRGPLPGVGYGGLSLSPPSFQMFSTPEI